MSDNLLTQVLHQLENLSTHSTQLRDHLLPILKAVARSDADRAAAVEQILNTVLNDVQQLQSFGQYSVNRHQQLESLMETIALVNSSLDPDTVMAQLVDTIINITGAERAFVVLREGADYNTYAARNWDQENVAPAEANFSRTIIEATLADGQPIVTSNAGQDPRFQDARSVATGSLRSVLCVPLNLRDETIGVVYVDNRLVGNMFNRGTVDVVTAFATQAAIAVENARRFKQVETDLERTQAELQTLRIEIDTVQRERAVNDITETEYFRRLQELAQERRSEFNRQDADSRDE